jgi:hypothetical protein
MAGWRPGRSRDWILIPTPAFSGLDTLTTFAQSTCGWMSEVASLENASHDGAVRLSGPSCEDSRNPKRLTSNMARAVVLGKLECVERSVARGEKKSARAERVGMTGIEPALRKGTGS